MYYEVVVARLDEGAEGVAALARLLREDERRRAGRFRFERDRRRYIVARARLRELLGGRLGEDPREVELIYGRHGKPALARGGLHFSVSHCEELAVFAFSASHRIGVDVEALRALPQADEIAARFFAASEYHAYRSLAPESRGRGFYNCWTRKEALAKALGDGLSMPLDGFGVSLAPGEPARVEHIEGVPGDGGWRLESLVPRAGFVAAVALSPR